MIDNFLILESIELKIKFCGLLIFSIYMEYLKVEQSVNQCFIKFYL